MAEYTFSPAEKATLRSEGALAGLEKISNQNPHAKQALDQWRASFLKNWGGDAVSESEKEVEKINAVLRRLKQNLNALDMNRGISVNDPKFVQLKNDIAALDGWTVSLLESVYSLINFYDGKSGREKVAKLSGSLQAMLNEGGKNSNPFDNKHHFSGYMG